MMKQSDRKNEIRAIRGWVVALVALAWFATAAGAQSRSMREGEPEAGPSRFAGWGQPIGSLQGRNASGESRPGGSAPSARNGMPSGFMSRGNPLGRTVPAAQTKTVDEQAAAEEVQAGNMEKSNATGMEVAEVLAPEGDASVPVATSVAEAEQSVPAAEPAAEAEHASPAEEVVAGVELAVPEEAPEAGANAEAEPAIPSESTATEEVTPVVEKTAEADTSTDSDAEDESVREKEDREESVPEIEAAGSVLEEEVILPAGDVAAPDEGVAAAASEADSPASTGGEVRTGEETP